MNDLFQRMVTKVDLLESEKPHGYPWKDMLDEIIDEISAVTTSIESQGTNTSNVLFQILAKQNAILMCLVLLSQISEMEK